MGAFLKGVADEVVRRERVQATRKDHALLEAAIDQLMDTARGRKAPPRRAYEV